MALHIWQCLQRHLCSTAYGFPQIAYMALPTMPFMQYCLWVPADCIYGIAYNAFYAVLLMGSRRLHIWHYLKCLLCSTAYGFPQIAYMAMHTTPFIAVLHNRHCLQFLLCSTAYGFPQI